MKQYDPKITTLIGSAHVTAIPEETMREFPQFDYGVVGEGEETLYELVGRLGDEKALSRTRGICFLDENKEFVFA